MVRCDAAYICTIPITVCSEWGSDLVAGNPASRAVKDTLDLGRMDMLQGTDCSTCSMIMQSCERLPT